MTILDDQRRAAAQPVAPSQPDLELDRTVATDELEALAADRRRTAAGPRLSWASAQPFVRRTRTEEPGEAQVPGWRVLVGGYRRRALLLDLLSALGAGGAVALAADASTTTLTWLAVTAAALLVLVAVFRGYDRRSVGNGPAEFQSLLRAGLGAAAFVALASVALGLTLPRLPIGAFLVLATPTAALGRYVLRRRLHGRRHEGSPWPARSSWAMPPRRTASSPTCATPRTTATASSACACRRSTPRRRRTACRPWGPTRTSRRSPTTRTSTW
ncbi:hypothetical protein [Cellulomonas soli]